MHNTSIRTTGTSLIGRWQSA